MHIMKAKLIRLEQSEQGTLGALMVDGSLFCCTLELPDRGNATNISRIPAGDYICSRVKSPKFGETFEILDVPGRSHVLFHAGNTHVDTHGCVLLGQYWGKLSGDRAILNSGQTFKSFMVNLANENDFKLSIEEYF